MMLKTGIVLPSLVVALSAALAGPVAAAVDFTTQPLVVTEVSPGHYTFVEGGFSGGASITGSFAGTDLNADGQLSYFTNPPEPAYPLELTDFSMSFSGNAAVPAFSLTFAQLDNFNYQFGPDLGDTSTVINGLTEGVEAGSTDRFWIAGPGPAALCDGSETCGGVLATPEPGSWVMLLMGLFGVGAPQRAARTRRRAIAV